MSFRFFLCLVTLPFPLLQGCGDDPAVRNSNDSLDADIVLQRIQDARQEDSLKTIKEIFATFRSHLDPLALPFWLHIDSTESLPEFHMVTSEKEALFPAGFEFPEEYQIGPFAYSDYGESTVFWYKVWIWFPGEEKSDIHEIWGVTYIDSLPVQVHRFASDDNGQGYALISRDGSIKEVWWEQAEDINVSLSSMIIKDGEFLEAGFVKEVFSRNVHGQAKSRQLIDDFLEGRYQWDD